MRRQSRRSWRGRQPQRLRSCKNPWTTALRSMRRKRLCRDRRRNRVVNQTSQLTTSQSPTSQQRVTVPAVCSLKWSDRPSPMARPGQKPPGTDSHRHCSRDEKRRRDHHSSSRDCVPSSICLHWIGTWWCCTSKWKPRRPFEQPSGAKNGPSL